MIDIKVKNRIEWFSKSNINDFAPTISPAPKNYDTREIESIRSAINYFLDRGIEHLVVQKKYMGSYCSIYLKNELDRSYFVSRNGYVIKHIDTDQCTKSIAGLHAKLKDKYPDFDTIIIASELMPWSALGTGLIEKEYLAYYDAYHTHNEYLTTNELYDKIAKVKSSMGYITYIKDRQELSSKIFKEKYKPHIIRQYDALCDLPILDLDAQRASLGIFKNQIDNYGRKEDINFKPFSILKIVFADGSEEIPNNNLTYADVNEDEFLELNFHKNNQEENIMRIYEFFEKLTIENEEGIMIKPAKSYISGVVPCFKIRNTNYLTMIYGVNFNMNYNYYLEKRNIKKKMEQSINGWEINWQLLQIPFHELNSENYLLKLLLLKRIQGEEIEKTLDTRL